MTDPTLVLLRTLHKLKPIHVKIEYIIMTTFVLFQSFHRLKPTSIFDVGKGIVSLVYIVS